MMTSARVPTRMIPFANQGFMTGNNTLLLSCHRLCPPNAAIQCCTRSEAIGQSSAVALGAGSAPTLKSEGASFMPSIRCQKAASQKHSD